MTNPDTDDRGCIVTTAPGHGADVVITDTTTGKNLHHHLVHDDYLIVTAGATYWAGSCETARRDGYIEHTLKIRVPVRAGES